jgi:hypothetical protein
LIARRQLDFDKKVVVHCVVGFFVF